MKSLGAVLQTRPYPGRGILAARTAAGTLTYVYFLTGRSSASRSRDIQLLPGGDVAVVDTTDGAEHDELRHYVAAARRQDWLVVGNGDQVLALAEALAAGRPTLDAWNEHTFEPDPPIFTTRIWAAHRVGAGPDVLLGYARRSHRGDEDVDRVARSVGTLLPGTGVLLTTYDRDAGDVHATATSEDVTTTATTPQDLVHEVWHELDQRLRVAAVAIDVDDPASTFFTLP